MSKITGAGTTMPAVVTEQPDSSSTPASRVADESTSQAQALQDPRDKVGGLKLEGQMREAQVRSQLDSHPQFKMPGVDFDGFRGPALNDPKMTEGFKEFDKPMPSVEMKWPEKGEFKQTEKDGKVQREMTDANGIQYKETVGKDGSRERETIDKDGNRRFEISAPSGYIIRGGADKKGNSWSIDSKGVSIRMHSDAEGRLYSERQDNGVRTRQMMDRKGYEFKETLENNGKVERESTDASGNRQFELQNPDGFSVKGFADNQGNSYTTDSNGTSSRMHHAPGDDRSYVQHSHKDGSKIRQIMDKQGNTWTETKLPNGSVTRTHEKIGA